jgi:hypothetical protein
MSPLKIFELILSLLVVALILPVATRRLPIPPASALILGGMVLAAIPGIPAVALHPDLIMLFSAAQPNGSRLHSPGPPASPSAQSCRPRMPWPRKQSCTTCTCRAG